MESPEKPSEDPPEEPEKGRKITSAAGKFQKTARKLFVTTIAQRFSVSYEFMDNLDGQYKVHFRWLPRHWSRSSVHFSVCGHFRRSRLT